MITQIYSIQTVQEALDCVHAGADYIGVAAATDRHLPAEVSLEQGLEIFVAIGDRAKKVALTVADSPEPIYQVIQQLKPDVIHVCGNQYYATADFAETARRLLPGLEVLQAIPVTGPDAIPAAEHYAAFCDSIILDSVDPKIAGIGAAGIVHDWDISAEICRRLETMGCKVILAGGLGPDNVAAAIRQVRPWGVDSFSKTSVRFTDGSSRKDPEMVRLFIERALAAAKELGI
ncbi:MAG TPA: phosphoribosylanthranilate isomerase [Bellilinea sp.]|nr:phosphoribosylanthranilate isomerase [Bellilinea sp.]